MDNALDAMFDIISGDAAPEDNIVQIPAPDNEEDNERAAIDELLGIHPPKVDIAPRPIMVEVCPFDPESNMVNPLIRDDFRSETIFRETDIFTAPQITTITMEGYLLNVNCHEEDIIKQVDPDEEFVEIKCNFGRKRYPNYTAPVKDKKSNRGRKKKPPKERKRKRQGTGECFNSQTTFVMPSSNTVVIDGKVPTDAVIYKFKVFRTGKIQLPGLKTTDVIDDVMVLAKRLVVLLNFHLHTCEEDPAKLIKIINLNPVMKNYKFRTKMLPNWIINLSELRNVFNNNRIPGGECPKIFDIKYTRQETKLSVRFSTPVHGNVKKRVRVNIFQSGKVNILGGHSKVITDNICQFINDIFERNNQIFTKLGSANEQLEDNILQPSDQPIPEVLPMPIIECTAEENEAVLELINAEYKKFICDVNSELLNMGFNM